LNDYKNFGAYKGKMFLHVDANDKLLKRLCKWWR